MLTDFSIHATVAVADLDRAQSWYRDKLGLEPKIVDPGGVWYEFAAGSWLLVYPTSEAGTARNTWPAGR